MKLTKHVGVETPSGARIALIMTTLPDSQDHCLIINPDKLPATLKDDFSNVLASNEGQAARDLADVLSRRLHSDSRTSILEALHNLGFLRRASIDSVEMNPYGNVKIPLRTVLEQSNIIQRKVNPEEANTKFNPHHHNAEAASVGEALGTARNLLIEADLLETEARAKRERAYNFAPSLRPQTDTAE